jgi:hypothetical protein
VVNDLVIVMLPEPLATFLADGGYLPRGVPLLKHIAGAAHQTVCRIRHGAEVGQALERDYVADHFPTRRVVISLQMMIIMNSHRTRWTAGVGPRFFGFVEAESRPELVVRGRDSPSMTQRLGYVQSASTRMIGGKCSRAHSLMAQYSLLRLSGPAMPVPGTARPLFRAAGRHG